MILQVRLCFKFLTDSKKMSKAMGEVNEVLDYFTITLSTFTRDMLDVVINLKIIIARLEII